MQSNLSNLIKNPNIYEFVKYALLVTIMNIKRALVSVSNKENIIEFIKGLDILGIEIISTGGTADFLKKKNRY